VSPLLSRYRTLLSRVDSWFRRVSERFPTKVSCHRGCCDCCLGLFDITPLDVALLREGMKELPAGERADIRERAAAVNAQLAAVEPRLKGQATLAGLTDAELDGVIDAMGPVRCPVLGPDGACRLYGHRPMVCRLNGIPVVDTRGRVIQREGCFKNSIAVGDAPASVIGIDYAAIRREEERLLSELGEGGGGRFVSQAVE
jgi:Fe-S-cluster containining protein